MEKVIKTIIEDFEKGALSESVALTKRYGKTSGYLFDLVFQRDLSDAQTILQELKKNTKICL